MVSVGRVSCTLIRQGFTSVWSDEGQGGFVIDPALAPVRCSYPRDGHSGGTQTGCQPWCPQRDWFGCARPPEELRQMLDEQARDYSDVAALPQEFVPMLHEMQERYNEVVLDGAQWREWLPASVEAIFMHASSSDEQKAHVRRVRAAFASAYGLQGRNATPLLMYDGQQTPPFWEAEEDG